MTIEVTYMSGAGNLFSVIDNRKYDFSIEQCSELSRILCEVTDFNKFATEGFLVINQSEGNEEFNVWFFNTDGTSGMMCGNGSRCSVLFAQLNDFYKINELKMEKFFKMAGNYYKFENIGKTIKVYFPPPKKIIQELSLEINSHIFKGNFIDVNSHHYVLNYDEIKDIINEDFDSFEINKFAIPLRRHVYFQPGGSNIDFYKVISTKTIYLRTFERGFEAETAACGTGAISTAISAYLDKYITLPVKIYPTSKQELIIDFKIDNNLTISSLSLEGGAEILNSIYIEIPDSILSKL